MKMNKQLHKIVFFALTVNCLLVVNGVFAQIQLTPYSPRVNNAAAAAPNRNMRVEAITDTLKLPFWDDFSQLDTNGRPLSVNWAERGGVTVNNDWAIGQPTRNVAVFDGTDANGSVYSSYIFKNGIGDSLVSEKINLSSFTETSNVALSFYYQCGGKAEAPDSVQGDYLLLSFKGDSTNSKRSKEKVWHKVWKQTGCAGKKVSLDDQNKFVYVYIPLDSAKYLLSDFQFKIQNFGKLSGAFDVWMVDYIYLNKPRIDTIDNPKDQYQSDRAANSVGNLFSKYTVIPYKHFYQVGATSFLNTNMNGYVSNLSTKDNPINGFVEISDSKTGLITPSFTFDVIPSGGEFNFKVKLEPTSPLNFVSQDSAQVIQTKLYIYDPNQEISAPLLGFPKEAFYKNDTVVSFSYLDSCYAYDDGVPEYSAAVGSRGAKVAYKYEIPVQNAIITGFRIYFSRNLKDITGTAFTPYVWRTLDKKGVGRNDEVLYPLAGKIDTAQTSVHYSEGGLPGFSDYIFRTTKPIVVSDSFYVGYAQNDYQNLQVGFDYNEERSTSHGLFSNVGTGWLQFNEAPGNLMIRPIFGSFATPTTRVDEEGISDIYLGPSPTTGIVQVLNEEIQEFRVNDATGRNVGGTLIKDRTGDRLDLSVANDGLYFVQLKVKGTWFNKKVIVIK